MPSTAILWFRRDLRLSDNPALMAALDGCERLLPVYLHAPDEEAPWSPGAASNWWLHHSLQALDACLRERGSRLFILRGDSLACLQALITATSARAVFWNRCYEPARIARDSFIKQQLRAQGIRCESHNGGLLFEPWEIKTGADQPFKVFSAFWRRATARLAEIPAPSPTPEVLPPLPEAIASGRTQLSKSLAEQPLERLDLLPRISWDAAFPTTWQPGAAGAQARLRRFLDQAAHDYAETREQPGVEGSSKLSPHLHFGEIGPREVLKATNATVGDHEAFVRELGWREFSVHLLFHFPQTAEVPLNPLFADFPWRDPTPPELLRAWQQGQTGIPLIDAGMRELWHSGWMHNRVRMIVASFLTKNLRIPWQTGARWFWDTLVDANLANNTQGWQWTAGCGADAAPYFRIFNPVRQGERFDPEGVYVRHWCPELTRLPKRYLHAPWTAPVAILQQSGVELGITYPRPIIDLADTRREALAFWQQLRDTDSRANFA
ncbi:cryptochrome/photolyase family protein [Thiorhodovibrio frisius]|uniref:Deoxyribodipyrimidine photo-lyase n=1 Tax=Thiorhodovibrio frisius TaxID=631362 RepID=H8Z3F3_9GAMM|nr:deoxyribodipyrimidine photo-lyase [Thiorhodovibrio frisius]EIC21861.1 deoxyribodipyrimidine photolyase [Thiorhodovibrio frisius]WPL21829.1 Deoxyribodipyrimidine photo-lyase [Thiorhodovibrio frisius]